jgi:osomolarity two-component system, sensor histidine kinase SLN1
MDGLEATTLIRQAGYKKPIVALSAYSDDTNVKSCHQAGMDDFISKPIQLARLRLVLKTYCPEEATSTPGSPTTGGTSAGPSGMRRGSRLSKGKEASLKEHSALSREASENGADAEAVSPMS